MTLRGNKEDFIHVEEPVNEPVWIFLRDSDSTRPRASTSPLYKLQRGIEEKNQVIKNIQSEIDRARSNLSNTLTKREEEFLDGLYDLLKPTEQVIRAVNESSRPQYFGGPGGQSKKQGDDEK